MYIVLNEFYMGINGVYGEYHEELNMKMHMAFVQYT